MHTHMPLLPYCFVNRTGHPGVFCLLCPKWCLLAGVVCIGSMCCSLKHSAITYVPQNHFQHLGHGRVFAPQEFHQLHTHSNLVSVIIVMDIACHNWVQTMGAVTVM